jgi:hypothetical protein
MVRNRDDRVLANANAFAVNSIVGALLLATEHPHGFLFGLATLLIGALLVWLSRGPRRRFERHIRENWQG